MRFAKVKTSLLLEPKCMGTDENRFNKLIFLHLIKYNSVFIWTNVHKNACSLWLLDKLSLVPGKKCTRDSPPRNKNHDKRIGTTLWIGVPVWEHYQDVHVRFVFFPARVSTIGYVVVSVGMSPRTCDNMHLDTTVLERIWDSSYPYALVRHRLLPNLEDPPRISNH